MKKQLLISLILVTSLTGCPQEDKNWPEQLPQSMQQIDYSCCTDQLHKLDFNYPVTVEEAMKGDNQALQKLLAAPLDMDLPTSYVHGGILVKVLKQINDETFAAAVTALDSKLNSPHPLFQEPLRDTLRNVLEGGFQFSEGQQSLKDFPATAKILAYNVK